MNTRKPTDIRKTYHYSDGMVCDICGERAAKFQIVGEVDSFGFELLDVCQYYYDKMLEEEKAYHKAFLEEHTCMAPTGKIWIATAEAGDGFDWWFTRDVNKAEVEYRAEKQDENWGAHCGLYDLDVRLVTVEEASEIAHSYKHRWDDDWEELRSYDQRIEEGFFDEEAYFDGKHLYD